MRLCQISSSYPRLAINNSTPRNLGPSRQRIIPRRRIPNPQVREPRRYYPLSIVNDIEDIELYRPGGFYPISIGDTFAGGRYRVLHKLGYGAASTVWLARDQSPLLDSASTSETSTLVALKVLSAWESFKQIDKSPEVVIPNKLNAILRAAGDTDSDPTRSRHHHVQVVKDYFMEKGPNGTHHCFVYPFAGPSLRSLFTCPGTTSGSRRLRGDLARKVAWQTATVIERMHSVGLVHGDLKTSDILFKVSNKVSKWPDNEVYAILGKPEMEETFTIKNSLPGLSIPRELFEPGDIVRLSFISNLLQENITIIDFGQSFSTNSKLKSKGYVPATATHAIHCMSPETHFKSICTTESDIWSLACTIFEIRAGSSLFEPFFGRSDVLRQTVLTLGKLPEPWWNKFKARKLWFEENGEVKQQNLKAEKAEQTFNYHLEKSSIYEQLRDIGELDEPLEWYWQQPMFEITGTRLEEDEVLLLGDLLEKMLKYHPKDRITIQEVVRHPWFKYTSARCH